jgi:hypothetical protein
MKVFGAAVASLCAVNGEYIRRHDIVGPRPEPVMFNGLLGIDMDALKPPQSLPELEKFRAEMNEVEQAQHDHIMKELEAAKKVEQEFLQSDLHKEALHNKLFHIVY